MLPASLSPILLVGTPLLLALGVALLGAWWFLPQAAAAPRKRSVADIADRIWPAWEAKYSTWRSSTALVSALLGAWIGSRVAGPVAAFLIGSLLSVVVPRVVRTLLDIPTNDYPLARVLIEDVRDSMARGQSPRDAFRRLEERGGAIGRFARDVNISVQRHPLPDVLRDLSRHHGPIMQQAVDQLALFVQEGFWGPMGLEALEHIKQAIDRRKRFDDDIRVKTGDMRRFRNGAIVLVPTVDFLLAAMNQRMYPQFLHTTFGVLCILTSTVLFLLLIFLPLWLAPSPELS